MKKVFASLLLILLTVQVLISQADQLIPRATFFEGEVLSQFKSNATGSTLYAISSADDSALSILQTGEPDIWQSIRFPGRISSWEPVNEHVLVICSGSTGLSVHWLLQNGDMEEISLPGGVTALRVLRVSSDAREVGLHLESADGDAVNGVYIFRAGQPGISREFSLPPYPQYLVDGQMKPVAAYERNGSGGNRFYALNQKGEWEAFLDHEWSMDMISMQFSRIISVSDEGREVYYTSNKDRDKTALYRYDRTNAQSSLLASSPLVDLIPFGYSSDLRGRVHSAVGLFARTIRVIADEQVSDDFSFLDQNLEGEVSFIQSLDHDRKWLIRELLGGIARIYLYHRESASLEYLCIDVPAFKDLPMAKRHARSVMTADGLHLPYHVYLPAGSDPDGDGIPDTPLPTIFYVHGGPWVGVSHWNSQFHCRNFQLLANRGYAVVNCEFRGSTGLGKVFVELSRKAWGTDMMSDKYLLVEDVKNAGIADPTRCAMWGWSYGGYATMTALAKSPELFACGMAMYGISDLESFGRIPFADNPFWHSWVGDPYDEADAEMLREYSAIPFADNIRAPLLLTTGSKDERVPQEQMDKMAERHHELGKEVVYFTYPEEVHDYRDPGSWISFWAIGEQFLAMHLGGWAQPAGRDLDRGNYTWHHGKDLVTMESGKAASRPDGKR